MNSELCRGATINSAEHLMGSEDVRGIIEKVPDWYDAWISDFLQGLVGLVSHGWKWDVEFGSPDWIFEELKPLLSLFELVVEEESFKVLHFWIWYFKSNRNDV